ncbi:Pumilio protein 1 [Fasciola hepatica]|uniref:Pumilio protein 1 n=1 Tax=Fasciola hepatica TaxID=6192 RepID=A0A2H1BUF6_FASHE|nr:Pumilio protein 1 [Fasciola hepatica]
MCFVLSTISRGLYAELCVHEFASTVVEKAVTKAARAESHLLISEDFEVNCGLPENTSMPSGSRSCSGEFPALGGSSFGDVSVDDTERDSALCSMMKDRPANYVVREMLDVSMQRICKELLNQIH